MSEDAETTDAEPAPPDLIADMGDAFYRSLDPAEIATYFPDLDTSKLETISGWYSEILGRPASAAEIFSQWDSSEEFAKGLIATSDEAQKAGIDPGKFGVTIVDPAALGKDEQAWYDVWKEAQGDAPLSRTVFDAWRQATSDPLDWKANLAGYGHSTGVALSEDGRTVVKDPGLWTQEGVDLAGGTLDFRGVDKGSVFWAPKDSATGSRLYGGRQEEGGDGSVYQLYQSLGNTSEGLFDVFSGIPVVDDLADTYSTALATNPLTADAGVILGGSQAREEAIGWWEAVGGSRNTYTKAADAGSMANAAVAAIVDAVAFGGLPVASTANQLTHMAAQGADSDASVDWAGSMEDLAYSWAGAAAGPAGSLALNMGREMSHGASLEDAVLSAGWGYAAGQTAGLSNFLRAQVSPDWQGVSEMAKDRGVTEYTTQDAARSLLFQAAMSSGVAGYKASLPGGPSFGAALKGSLPSWERTKGNLQSMGTVKGWWNPEGYTYVGEKYLTPAASRPQAQALPSIPAQGSAG